MTEKRIQITTMLLMLVITAVVIAEGHSKEENQVDILRDIIILIVGGAVSFFVGWLTSRRSQINKNTDSINKLIERLGKFESRTLENMLGINTDESLSGQFRRLTEKFDYDIGVDKSHASLTSQHDDIFNYLKSKDKNSASRLASFSMADKNINNSLEEIKLFFSDWERKHDIIDDLTTEKILLERKVNDLTIELNEYRNNTGSDQSKKNGRLF